MQRMGGELAVVFFFSWGVHGSFPLWIVDLIYTHFPEREGCEYFLLYMFTQLHCID